MWPVQLCLDRLFWYTHVHTVRRIWQFFPTLSVCFLSSFHSQSLLLPMGPGRPPRPGHTGMGPVGTDQYKLSLSVEGTEWILTRTSEGGFECKQKAALSHMSPHREGIKKAREWQHEGEPKKSDWIQVLFFLSSLLCLSLCTCGLPSAAGLCYHHTLVGQCMLCFSSSCFL